MDGLKYSKQKWILTNKTGKERVNGNINALSSKRDTLPSLNKSNKTTKYINKLRENT